MTIRTNIKTAAVSAMLLSATPILTLTQCSSSSSQSAGATDGGTDAYVGDASAPDSSSDGGIDSAVTALCTTFWNARCTEYSSCYSVGFGTNYTSVSDCVSNHVAPCVSQYTSDGTTVTTATLSACFAAYGTLACNDLLAFLEDPSHAVPAACAAIQGTRADGAACAFDTECVGGRCEPGQPCGQCATRGKASATCAGSGDCAYGLTCYNQQCAARVPMGGNCTSARCDVGLVCTNDTCVSLLATGATCDPNAPDPTCNWPNQDYCDSTTMTCKTYTVAGMGQPCGFLYSSATQSYSFVGDCRADLRCAQNATRAFCIPETTAGQGCLLASGPGIVTPPPPSQCDDKDKCVQGLCVPITAQSCESYVPPAPPTGPNPGQLPVVPNLGGSIMTTVDYITVTWPGYPYASVNTMADYIFSSGWLAKVGGEYGLQGGSHTASVTLTDLLPGDTSIADAGADAGTDTITNEQLQDFLVSEIQGGKLPTPAPYTPGHGTIYALHLPAEVVISGAPYGTTCQTNGGYHDLVISPYQFAYTVIPTCAPYSGFTAEQLVQSTVAHEIIEAMTDPALNMSRAFILDQPNPWNATGGELADLCEYNYETEGGFLFQRIYSNKAAVAGGDPCLPLPTPTNYYNLVGPANTMAAAGATVTVPLTAWVSGTPPTSWTVYAYQLGGTANATSDTLDQTMMTPTGTANLVVTIPSNATSGSTIISEVQSWVDNNENHIWVNTITVQ